MGASSSSCCSLSSSSCSHHHHRSSKRHHQNPNPSSSSSSYCSLSSPSSCNKHSASATLDLIILILVICSCAFLIASSLSHIVRSLSKALTLINPTPITYLLPLLLLFSIFILLANTSRLCSRKCANPTCKGLTRALEFDVQIQTEDCLKDKGKDWKEIEKLPWKGGLQGRNPDYQVLRAELKKMAPINGRAVLLFRARCGCSLAKLEAWGPKMGRRQKR